MAFGFGLWNNREESSGTERRTGNRPDCAYFLLLGLCGAAFLLTIGGILTYIAFNPGSADSRPHSPLSHIPHFHHHRKHHDRTEGHYFGHFEQHTNYHHDELKQQQHHHQQQQHHSNNSSPASPSNSSRSSGTGLPEELVPSTTSPVQKSINGTNGTVGISQGEIGTTPGSHLPTAHLSSDREGKENLSAVQNQNHSHYEQDKHLSPTGNNSSHRYHHPLLESAATHHLNQQQKQHSSHPGLTSSGVATHRHEGNNTHHANVEMQAKESLALAIIGGLCLTCGVLVTIIVGVFALKYDCDHEPEPNIAFLRLRSEMSLNFDQSKNNYELLMPASSSTAAGVGSTHSIHPGGMPRC